MIPKNTDVTYKAHGGNDANAKTKTAVKKIYPTKKEVRLKKAAKKTVANANRARKF